jgi:hypothetical protein
LLARGLGRTWEGGTHHRVVKCTTTTNDDIGHHSSFGCHIAVGDVAPHIVLRMSVRGLTAFIVVWGVVIVWVTVFVCGRSDSFLGGCGVICVRCHFRVVLISGQSSFLGSCLQSWSVGVDVVAARVLVMFCLWPRRCECGGGGVG